MEVLVLGLGNLLLGDEGVGVHAAQRLRAGGLLPPEVAISDAGTDILGVVDLLGEARNLIVIDAMKGGSAPGSVYLTRLSECEAKEVIASLHGFDLNMALALSGKSRLAAASVIGVEPAAIDWSLELSETLEQAMPAVLKLAYQQINICLDAN